MRLVLSMFIAATASSTVGAQPFDMQKPTVAGGGGEVSSGSFALRGVVTPQAGGRLEGGTFILTGGLFPLNRTDPSCPADVNGDGVLSPGDFNAWVVAFNSQLPGCDQNGDGVCTPGDFNAWIANFNAGCD